MDAQELLTQSFIIKFWGDDTGAQADHQDCHGQITHVISGKQFCIKNLEDIETFILPFLNELDIETQSDWFNNVFR